MIGTLVGIRRYPVKSMLGETLEAATLRENGIPGDRAWAVRDELRGGIRGGKKIPELMHCSARYVGWSGAGDVPAPEIELPNGDVFPASASDAGTRIGEAVGREVTLWPLLPADALDHYRRGQPDNPDFEQELRAIFGREPDEPLPNIGKFPPEILEYESPPGTYFDAFPLLLLSQQSLDSLADVAPDSPEVSRVIEFAESFPGVTTELHNIRGTTRSLTELYLLGSTGVIPTKPFEEFECVETVVRITEKFRAIGRHGGNLEAVGFEYNGVHIGQDTFHLFPGLCAVDSPENLDAMFGALAQHSIVTTRAERSPPCSAPLPPAVVRRCVYGWPRLVYRQGRLVRDRFESVVRVCVSGPTRLYYIRAGVAQW